MPEDDSISGIDAAVLTVFTADDLSAYLDGEVSDAVAKEVESLVEEDPRAGRWLAAYTHQVACMYRAFGAGADDVPGRLREVVRGAADAQTV